MDGSKTSRTLTTPSVGAATRLVLMTLGRNLGSQGVDAMSRINLIAAGLTVVVTAFVAVAQEPLQHTKDSLDTVKHNLKAGKAVLLDVREQKEWDAGHLKDAQLVPQSKLKMEPSLAELLKSLPKDKIVYTHCRAGTRALNCGEILKKHGFDVRPLQAGYQDLVEAGFEKAKDRKQ
jgi:phage shock protein E